MIFVRSFQVSPGPLIYPLMFAEDQNIYHLKLGNSELSTWAIYSPSPETAGVVPPQAQQRAAACLRALDL